MPTKTHPKVLRYLGPLFGLAILIAVGLLLHKQIKHLTLAGIEQHLTAIPTHQILLALLFTLCSYLTLSLYDILSMLYIRGKVPWYKTAFASLLSYIFSNNIGLSLLGASAMRFRFYPAWGISPTNVFRIVGFTWLSVWLGIIALAGLSLTINPISLPEQIHIPDQFVRPIGILCIIAILVYLILCHKLRRAVRLPGHIWLYLPKLRLAIFQPIIGMADWSIAALVLYTLLPEHHQIHFFTVLSIYIIAQLIGIASHVPAGLGVFDATLLLMLSPYLDANAALSAIILFRGIYYLIPLAIGGIIILTFELHNLFLKKHPPSPPHPPPQNQSSP
ncbi:lysylphosphatidylglycerol synthase domain-containing protein [Poriferisphaera sp. WC338]|uniref:lysylphosphatidylglycerol synthase domain-containing protein n=1 Tax=Poriferisphaera sp. WC338 TaxID=3425129 RepID=UPI003D8193AD